MNKEQIEAAKLNPDLRKKLIVDRIKRKTMGESAFKGQKAMSSVVEDPGQADWAKYKSLREIEHVRKMKKDLMISQMAGTHLSDTHRIHVCPGVASFFKYSLENRGPEKIVYTVKINDKERNLTQDDEVQLVYAWEEIEYWSSLGKAELYPSRDSIRQSDTVHLESG